MADTGNKTHNGSMLEAFLALKQNIFRTLNVAEVCVVREINDNKIRCEYLSIEGMYIEAVPSVGLTIAKGDVVLVVFTNHDFRTGLAQYKQNNPNTYGITDKYHNVQYGVIISVVYTKS